MRYSDVHAPTDTDGSLRLGVSKRKKVGFVEVKAVSKPDATHIAEAVCSIMDWKNKLVALTTDGASVVTGVHNDVVTKLCADRPNVLGIHCMAHKLELVFSD